ncbi:High affinity cationic amino acid transporter 1 [Eufriesea mexicana]|uniref:High affinity cationic amino acid transporter 1 n=1 Tax=Eufriesea mexicana TaxID=516756 RepID=A0A310STV1_9HYME|nr:PREDICTED: cationic amino acid transporter 3 [Eufriesea mexicana]XP_017760976.1 PREDICTED: cationic amino acid transporter 3 [Eufriesea mexicana]XP_017760983.1 PREDICTED: cationic amino acid transporter 3 [Eufriesea mexicana]XP_017760990.1 PREDICTED: cationic amino acid transporter 3 [Eufriesea mexicana]OAD62068.1 High affinity cationic amino acid transporter 1 [Eufriesea mexicana]
MASRLWKTLSRRRIDNNDESKSELARVLGLFDLTALGVGSTLGLGVYVLAGSIAKETAGPAVCISFLIAAIASGFAGMCYAEFASRVPKAGSAYIYSYVTVGEFIAFIIGWNLILEYVIGTASVARGLSNYLDELVGNVISRTLSSAMPMNVSFLSEYPDFFAFGVVLLLIILLSMGVKESTVLNNIFTVMNLTTILVIIVAGSIKADPLNWQIPMKEIPPTVQHAGSGGFMPFGVTGVMMGAAKCFYGFVGFDTVATTGEEAKNPQRNIPIAIVISLIIILLAYFSISTVLTMMLPYYDQNADAPFPHVFEKIGWPTIKWIVNIGATFALCTSLLGAMFPLPRILYAMGSDGVIFKQLANVHPKTMTPIFGTVVSGLFTGIMTLIFNLQQLIDMMSIGTLLAYTIVAVSVLILRYQEKECSTNTHSITTMNSYELTPLSILKQVVNLQNQKEITEMSNKVAKCCIAILCIVILVIAFLINYVGTEAFGNNVIECVILVVLLNILLLIIIIIARQPTCDIDIAFKVPFVPLLPSCSIFINLYLMLQLDAFTWIRFSVWLLIGFIIYFFYGISHSEQGKRDKTESEMMKQKYADQVRTVTSF